MWRWTGSQLIRVAIDRVYPLEEAGAALRRLASGDAVGRIVVVP
jgi:NADPH:quinone reductase-like Zn-dependent oxidoreductase